MSIEASDIKSYSIDELHKALENGEFQIYLQPKFNPYTLQITGAEALTRWIRNGDVIMPSEYISIFLKNGFIKNLDYYVLNRVCEIIQNIMETKKKLIPISINVSKQQLYEPGFLLIIDAMIKNHNVSPKYVEIEMLESEAIENIERMDSILKGLHNIGTKCAMDDFGKLYSSFEILKELDFDIVKIDRSFLVGIENNRKSQEILKTMLSLTNILSSNTTVEGVENKEQLELVKEYGCNDVQGFYFEKPIPVSEFMDKYL